MAHIHKFCPEPDHMLLCVTIVCNQNATVQQAAPTLTLAYEMSAREAYKCVFMNDSSARSRMDDTTSWS